MINLLKKLHDAAEVFQGRALATLLLAIFLIFALIGAGIGLFLGLPNDTSVQDTIDVIKSSTEEPDYYEGRVTYVNPKLYPGDDISFVLIDSRNNKIILLKSVDDRLLVSEGHYAKIHGTLTKTVDNKEDVLLVDRVIIQNGAN